LTVINLVALLQRQAIQIVVSFHCLAYDNVTSVFDACLCGLSN